MDLIKQYSNENVLIICETKHKSQFEGLTTNMNYGIKSLEEFTEAEELSQDVIFVQLPKEQITNSFSSKVLQLIRPGGKLVITKIGDDVKNIEFMLKTSGYVNVEVIQNDGVNVVTSMKPKYKIGSAAGITIKKKPAVVWKLDDESGDEETIDPDNLLDNDDLKKPDISALRVCGTTGKRKACKDCSCGLAEELTTEVQNGKVVDTSNAPKSSCGSCYLGDAFRCASCPYLGMPAFKPGEKIQLASNLLKSDI